MKGSMIRTAIDELANETIKKNILHKLSPQLKDRLDAEGGDIDFDVEHNSYTISGCSKELADKIAEFLRSGR